METAARRTIALGAILALLGVALGAVGAHAMKDAGAEALARYHTANEFHLVHALGLIAVGILRAHMPASRLLAAAAWLMGAGVVLFSGGLYLRAWTDQSLYSLTAPWGGMAWMAAWLLLALAMLRKPSNPE